MSKNSNGSEKTHPTDSFTAVVVRRESSLGYRSYKVKIVAGTLESIEPLHGAPDLPQIALEHAEGALMGIMYDHKD